MVRYVLRFDKIDQTQGALVGGKGAHLGELSRIEGVRVPAGFCITTHAFQRIMTMARSIDPLLDQLSGLKPDDRNAIGILSAQLRQIIEGIIIPADVAEEITQALDDIGADSALAVRSSATAEDLPTASFAGQQDTYLNMVGPAEVLDSVRRCWASLFTDRAVIYRMRNGFDHRKVRMAVVVQRMVFAEVSGILFTADPVSGNRKVASIDASFGLGEALVAGLVNPDVYKVRAGEIVAKTISSKRLAIEAAPGGGTRERLLDDSERLIPALTDGQVIELDQTGRQIEAHFGRPQDIEWCFADGAFQIVQSRPITTLFPIPPEIDGENHVYLSVGHQQMMTDPFKPLGLSFWQLCTARPMAEAGGRLFVDVTKMLESPASRASMLGLVGKSDPLVKDALENILDRPHFLRLATNDSDNPISGALASILPPMPPIPLKIDPDVVTAQIKASEDSIAALKRNIKGKSGTELLDFILSGSAEHKRILFHPESHRIFMTAIEATWWINENMQLWLGEKNAADILAQSVDHNITSEMGLELLDVADVFRKYPDTVWYLENVETDLTPDNFLERLDVRVGGPEARQALASWLDKYGMRGAGEIDITRLRWSERPSMLIPLLLGNVKNAKPGDAKRRFDQGLIEAKRKEEELLRRLLELPDGEAKAQETKQNIDRIRTFIGYREYPKYGKIAREFVYKQALMQEAERLVNAGVIREKEDIFYFRFDELPEVVRTGHANEQLIRERKEAFKSFEALRPPRVLTSEGEGINGSFRRDHVPEGALVGLPVSTGIIEGRARVFLDMTQADLQPGDILVTVYTDPSWTPLFVGIAALVTEVGGMMTHGAVIAREYGLPAVVGVANATTLIRDGQRIRVDGVEGLVEVLG